MKYIQFTPGSTNPEELYEKLNKHFGSKYSVTKLHQQTTVAQDKAIGCKVIPMKKRIMVNGTFATNSRMMLAMLIGLLGGIVIPAGIYLFVYKPKFQAIEKEVYDFLASEYTV